MIKNNRVISLIIIFLIYSAAGALGIGTYYYLQFDFWLNLLIADAVATVAVFLFSLIFSNASCYDAYWSVAPMVIMIVLLFTKELNVVRILLAVAILGWGARLTANWVYTFENLNWEDWRYVYYKKKSGCLYPIVNFFGIHLMPTIIVYSCILPAVYAFETEVTLNFWSILFFITAVLSFVIQGIADVEMHIFRKNKDGIFIRKGLWKNARHPNYLGEICMWWSIGLLSVLSMNMHYYLLGGALLNTLLSVFISVPLAERHQRDRKPGFDEYKSETRMFLPIPRFSRKKTDDIE